MSLEKKIDDVPKRTVLRENMDDYIRGCVDPDNARLYGTFQQRAALNITQFPKIQGSMLIRMGFVYPIVSYLVEKTGLPADASQEIFGVTINFHTWIAGYLAYLTEIQGGLSKYATEGVVQTVKRVSSFYKRYFSVLRVEK